MSINKIYRSKNLSAVLTVDTDRESQNIPNENLITLNSKFNVMI